MKTSSKLVAIGVAALLVGIFLAYPLFVSDLNYAPPTNSIGRVRIGIDVVYAYFALEPNQTDTVFWQSYNESEAEAGIVNYLIILNVTNYSNETVYMDSFDIEAAQSYNSWNNQTTVGYAVQYPFLECSRETTGEYLNTSTRLAPTRWEPWEDRLVAFSGITEITNTTLLRTGSFYIGSTAEGTPINGVPSQAYGAGSKLITTTISGNEYVYNDLLSGNHVLRFEWNGQIAYVDEG